VTRHDGFEEVVVESIQGIMLVVEEVFFENMQGNMIAVEEVVVDIGPTREDELVVCPPHGYLVRGDGQQMQFNEDQRAVYCTVISFVQCPICSLLFTFMTASRLILISSILLKRYVGCCCGYCVWVVAAGMVGCLKALCCCWFTQRGFSLDRLFFLCVHL
jgi:hypothetical protein